jgi:carboxyl-terminal processing protease
MKGTPGDLGGIKAGDYITHLDGKLIYGGSLDDAVDQMRGPRHQIKLTVYRPGRDEPLDFTLTRRVIELKPVEWKVKDNVGVISVSSFSRTSGRSGPGDQGAGRAQAGASGGRRARLRGNPGACSKRRFPCPTISSTRAPSFRSAGARPTTTRSIRPSRRHRAGPADDRADRRRLGLGLRNRLGALQDQHRALIMGQRSFGKGSVQTLIPLGKDAALKLTTARYYTPSGRSVQEGGIEPTSPCRRFPTPTCASARCAPIARATAPPPDQRDQGRQGSRKGQGRRSALQDDARGTQGQGHRRFPALLCRPDAQAHHARALAALRK